MANWTVRRLEAIRNVLDAHHYIEIGVAGGGTFNNFDVTYKDAVDPQFLFPTEKYANSNHRFFNMTSDAFFANEGLRGRNKRYDIAFIDGLHTFEQTLRDFLAVLPLMSDKFFILIDDTVPSDIYSAEGSQKLATELRYRETQSIKKDWHGDVFKLVYFIHDFCPTLSYASISDNGNPQTLVWRESRPTYKAAFSSLTDIRHMSYGDMYERRQLLCEALEVDVLKDLTRIIESESTQLGD